MRVWWKRRRRVEYSVRMMSLGEVLFANLSSAIEIIGLPASGSNPAIIPVAIKRHNPIMSLKPPPSVLCIVKEPVVKLIRCHDYRFLSIELKNVRSGLRTVPSPPVGLQRPVL